MTKVHFEKITHIKDRTITGTLCGRMVCDGFINSTGSYCDVTCKLCQDRLEALDTTGGRK